MLAVFLVRVKPASTSAKPGCMKNTSMAASNIHTVLTPDTSWATVSEAAEASSAGASTAVVTSVATAARLSVAALSCANVSVVKQNAMDMARAIHSLARLHLICLSINLLDFSCIVFS